MKPNRASADVDLHGATRERSIRNTRGVPPREIAGRSLASDSCNRLLGKVDPSREMSRRLRMILSGKNNGRVFDSGEREQERTREGSLLSSK
jgi:hypothetical protein